MSTLRYCAIALLLAAGSTGAAIASTGASVQLTGDGVDLNVGIDTSTATFDIGTFDVALAPGASVEETFDYTVRVTDDGLAATRAWQFCTPVFQADCGPVPTGHELAYASLWLGRDPTSSSDSDVWIDDTTSFLTFRSVTGTPGLYTGTIDYTATNTSQDTPQFTTVSILGAVFADVAAPSAVPEPSAGWLWLAGLFATALTGLRRRGCS